MKVRKYNQAAINAAADWLNEIRARQELTAAERVLYDLLSSGAEEIVDFDYQAIEHRDAARHIQSELAEGYLLLTGRR